MRYLLFSIFFLLSAVQPASPWAMDELIGKKAPDFSLKDMNEKTVSLSSYKGNVVIVTFWATWCPPCRSEMPLLNKLYRELRNKGFMVVAVATDRSVSAVKDFLSKSPVDFPVVMDTDSKVSRQFKVFSMPTTFLLDKNGKVVQRFLGEEEWDSAPIREKITPLLTAQ